MMALLKDIFFFGQVLGMVVCILSIFTAFIGRAAVAKAAIFLTFLFFLFTCLMLLGYESVNYILTGGGV